MDDKSFSIRVPKRWVRVAMIVGVTALIVAPLTAIASHSFTDVPDSNTFHSDIEWMKDAGVTKGCNPPDNTEYCPDDNVTRSQMAAFMNRFAGYIGATDGTPAQADNATTADSATTAGDADTVDGKHAEDVAAIAAADVDSTSGGTTVSTVTTINDVTITVPVDGILVINGSAFINAGDDFPAGVGLKPFLNGTPIGVHGAIDQMTTADDDTDELEHFGYTSAVAVSAGTHTVTQAIGGLGTGGSLVDGALFFNANNLSVLFVPAGTVSDAGSASSSGSTSVFGD